MYIEKLVQYNLCSYTITLCIVRRLKNWNQSWRKTPQPPKPTYPSKRNNSTLQIPKTELTSLQNRALPRRRHPPLTTATAAKNGCSPISKTARRTATRARSWTTRTTTATAQLQPPFPPPAVAHSFRRWSNSAAAARRRHRTWIAITSRSLRRVIWFQGTSHSLWRSRSTIFSAGRRLVTSFPTSRRRPSSGIALISGVEWKK